MTPGVTNETKGFAILVPLLPKDLPSVESVQLYWANNCPPVVDSNQRESIDLIYVLNVGESFDLREEFDALLDRTGIKKFFRSVTLQFADLDPEFDYYVRDRTGLPPTDHGFTAGPNAMFFHLAENLGPEYESCFLMELDCLPVRDGWGSLLKTEFDSFAGAWVVGSRYHGMSWLPQRITQHLNGNALYRFSDPDFQSFIKNVWKPRLYELTKSGVPDLAYDCVYATLAHSAQGMLTPADCRAEVAAGFGKFCETALICNLGGANDQRAPYSELDGIRRSIPRAAIIHDARLADEVYPPRTNSPAVSGEVNDKSTSPVSTLSFSIKHVWVSESSWNRGNRFALLDEKATLLVNVIVDPGKVDRITLKVVSIKPAEIVARRWYETYSSGLNPRTVFVALLKDTRLWKFAKKALAKSNIRDSLKQIDAYDALLLFRKLFHLAKGKKIARSSRSVTLTRKQIGKKGAVSFLIAGTSEGILEGHFTIGVERNEDSG